MIELKITGTTPAEVFADIKGLATMGGGENAASGKSSSGTGKGKGSEEKPAAEPEKEKASTGEEITPDMLIAAWQVKKDEGVGAEKLKDIVTGLGAAKLSLMPVEKRAEALKLLKALKA